MLEKSLGLLFFLRKPRPFRKGPRLVFLRITMDGVRKELSLKITWERSRWDSKTNRAIWKKAGAQSINNYLELILSKAHESRTTCKGNV
ncbi:MAG: Arm DNA-binding domain-containing protein [Rhabdochlamydiaceae bacterium]